MCAFGVYISVLVCIDGMSHALWMAVMSRPEDHSLLIIFALISSCIIVPCGQFYSCLT